MVRVFLFLFFFAVLLFPKFFRSSLLYSCHCPLPELPPLKSRANFRGRHYKNFKGKPLPAKGAFSLCSVTTPTLRLQFIWSLHQGCSVDVSVYSHITTFLRSAVARRTGFLWR
ncbi:hypothetical protein K1719_022512 [Acacia pycnantha]|nr:hypothetical protein K1719_022512 [Acacia pycnantha]